MREMTLGHLLLNESLPPQYKLSGPIDKKVLKTRLSSLAKEDPRAYTAAITNIKRIGDLVATREGISIGLDDIAPDPKAKGAFVHKYNNLLGKAKSDEEKGNILVQAQREAQVINNQHTGTMNTMRKSGGRGNTVQMMKMNVAPVVIGDRHGKPIPQFISHSYSEGLTPGEYWTAGNEARELLIKGQLSTAEPGDLGKVLSNNMNSQVVTVTDCGTDNGRLFSITDPNITDRYLAKPVKGRPRNTLITSRLVSDLRKQRVADVVVRSPLTCESKDGVCQKCMGLNERGQSFEIGTNAGLRSAQALTEPLTQMVLSSKHGINLVDDDNLKGYAALRQTVDSPGSFVNKAILAEKRGRVTQVSKAPQGGNFVHVDGDEHYVPPNLRVTVKVGDNVYAGDQLSSGTPAPADVVRLRGLGMGRDHMVREIDNIYKGSGVNLDQRHAELLTRSHLNHVQLQNSAGDFLRGDTVEYNRLKDYTSQGSVGTPVDKAVDQTLAADYLHYTAGTLVTPFVRDTLKRGGITEVRTSTDKSPTFQSVFSPLTRAPLNNPDWMARLNHRWLKDSIMSGAQFGQVTDVHGVNPIPALAYGKEFGKGKDGKY